MGAECARQGRQVRDVSNDKHVVGLQCQRVFHPHDGILGQQATCRTKSSGRIASAKKRLGCLPTAQLAAVPDHHWLGRPQSGGLLCQPRRLRQAARRQRSLWVDGRPHGVGVMNEIKTHVKTGARGTEGYSIGRLQYERKIPRRSVVSWILYDLANTIFSMGVLSLYFSLFVRSEVGIDRADGVYGVISAVSMGLIFVLSPALGAMTDRARRRMPFLVGATLLCVASTALIGAGPFSLSVLLFVLANAAYQAGVQFYDSLLPEVTHAGNRGRISGIGVGIGYVGSYIAVGAGLLIAPDNHQTLFGVLAASFLLFALPCFFFVGERGNPSPKPVFTWQALLSSAGETLRTMRSTQEFPGLARFLVGRVFYTDAINTVIAYMGLYTVNVSLATGLSAAAGRTQAQLVLLSAVSCSVVGGFVWGRAVDRFGPKRTLEAVLVLWLGVFAMAAAIGAFVLPIFWLYIVAGLAGIALGGIWSADRPYMLLLSPPSRIGEFYGLYGMVGRFSAISGPLLWAAIVHAAVDWSGLTPLMGQSMAIVSLLVMTLVGFLILRRVVPPYPMAG